MVNRIRHRFVQRCFCGGNCGRECNDGLDLDVRIVESGRKFAEKGGVVGVYFMPYLAPDSHPTGAKLLDHIDYVAKVGGEDHAEQVSAHDGADGASRQGDSPRQDRDRDALHAGKGKFMMRNLLAVVALALGGIATDASAQAYPHKPIRLVVPYAEDRVRLAQLVELLELGLKDEAIARYLGVSLRTVRRRVAHLMAVNGVDTRFQLGWALARRRREDGRVDARSDFRKDRVVQDNGIRFRTDARSGDLAPEPPRCGT